MTLNEVKQIVLQNLPDADVRPQPADEWQGPFPLPDAVLAYYAEVGPVDLNFENYGNPWYVPSLARLWELQAGYRYNPNTGERFPQWSEDWLVVAYEGGDPCIFDLRTGTILHAHHGQGAWDPEPLFDDLGEMLSVFAVLGGVIVRAGERFTDDESCILPEYYREAETGLEAILGSQVAAAATLSTLGWG